MKIIPNILDLNIIAPTGLARIINNISWLFLDRVIKMGIGLTIGVWIGRYLGPGQYGIISYATALVGLFSALAGLGLQGIVVRDIVRRSDCKEEILGTAAALQLIGSVFGYLAVITLITWMKDDDPLTRTITSIIGTIILVKASDVAAYWFDSQVQSKYVVLAQDFTLAVFAIIKMVLILNNADITSFAWATATESLIISANIIIVFNLKGLKLTSLRFSLACTRSLLNDSWPLLISSISIIIYMKIDQIMIGQIIGSKELGVYSAVARISEIWYFVPTAIADSVFPSILRSKIKNEEDYYRRLQILYDVLFWLSMAICISISMFSSELIVLLFGEAYREGGSVLAIHTWATVFVSLGVVSGKWFISENLQSMRMIRNLLGVATNIILNTLLIPTYGITGAAISTVISVIISAFLSDLITKKTRQQFRMKLASLNFAAVIIRIRNETILSKHIT